MTNTAPDLRIVRGVRVADAFGILDRVGARIAEQTNSAQRKRNNAAATISMGMIGSLISSLPGAAHFLRIKLPPVPPAVSAGLACLAAASAIVLTGASVYGWLRGREIKGHERAALEVMEDKVKLLDGLTTPQAVASKYGPDGEKFKPSHGKIGKEEFKERKIRAETILQRERPPSGPRR